MPLSDYASALVTGASSGIGEAVVRALTARDMRVIALARRRERLEALATETGCETLVLDLRDTDALYARLAELDVDVLVNNAGMGRGYDTLFKASREDIDRTLETNVTAAVHVVRAVTPGMIARKRGHLVNVGSIAGLYPLVSSLYGASKGAVHLLSQNLRMELSGSGVRCTEICPGRVATEFFETAVDDPERRRRMVADLEALQPSDIAAAIVFALDLPWRVNISTIELTPTEQAPGGAIIERAAR